MLRRLGRPDHPGCHSIHTQLVRSMTLLCSEVLMTLSLIRGSHLPT